MKYLILILALISSSALAQNENAWQYYARAGVGYHLTNNGQWHYDDGVWQYPNNDLHLRLGVGIKKGCWRIGVDHFSDPANGRPFNDKPDFSRTTVFVDYEVTFDL